jgi:hypothetical protein
VRDRCEIRARVLDPLPDPRLPLVEISAAKAKPGYLGGVAGYIVFGVGAAAAAGSIAVWVNRRFADRRARAGRRW